MSMMMTDSLPLLQQTMAVTPKQQEEGKDSTTAHPLVDDTCHSQMVIEDLSCPDVVPLSAADLRAQLATVAVDWRPLRQCGECAACGYDLDGDGTFKKRLHCR